MSDIQDCLGLAHGSELLEHADRAWAGWSENYPALRAVADTTALRSWLKNADPAPADEVLLALARLAATDGGDDAAAAGVLAWVLLPGAYALRASLRLILPRLDEQILASQLWLEARTFPWQRLAKVAANILCNTRTGVLAEYGISRRAADRIWTRTVPVADDALTIALQVAADGLPPSESAGDELAGLLDAARDRDIISEQDQVLLLQLVEVADRLQSSPVRSGGGLLSRAVTVEVGRHLGIAEATTRRRARRCIDALQVAVQDELVSA